MRRVPSKGRRRKHRFCACASSVRRFVRHTTYLLACSIHTVEDHFVSVCSGGPPLLPLAGDICRCRQQQNTSCALEQQSRGVVGLERGPDASSEIGLDARGAAVAGAAACRCRRPRSAACTVGPAMRACLFWREPSAQHSHPAARARATVEARRAASCGEEAVDRKLGEQRRSLLDAGHRGACMLTQGGAGLTPSLTPPCVLRCARPRCRGPVSRRSARFTCVATHCLGRCAAG